METAETLEAINQTVIETPPQSHVQESPAPASDPLTVAEQTEAAVWESLMEIRYA